MCHEELTPDSPSSSASVGCRIGEQDSPFLACVCACAALPCLARLRLSASSGCLHAALTACLARGTDVPSSHTTCAGLMRCRCPYAGGARCRASSLFSTTSWPRSSRPSCPQACVAVCDRGPPETASPREQMPRAIADRERTRTACDRELWCVGRTPCPRALPAFMRASLAKPLLLACKPHAPREHWRSHLRSHLLLLQAVATPRGGRDR